VAAARMGPNLPGADTAEKRVACFPTAHLVVASRYMKREAQPDGNWERHPVAVTGRCAPELGVRRYQATSVGVAGFGFVVCSVADNGKTTRAGVGCSEKIDHS